jgi:hypothetical protein
MKPTRHKQQHRYSDGTPVNAHVARDTIKPAQRHGKSVLVFLVAVILTVFTAGPVLAVSLTATVDKTKATVEDTILLTLSVEGDRNSAEPILPQELKREFKIQSRGSSSRVQIVNGKINSGIDYNYILYPRKTGTFTVGPASILVKGTKHESKPFTIQILPAQKEIDSSQDIFITSEVDKRNPYVNEQVLYTFRFYRAVRAVNPRLLEDINFEGFYIEKLGKEKEFTVTRGGKKYVVTELKQAIFPTEAGKTEIPAARLQVDVMYRSKRRGLFNDPFFDDSFFGVNQTKTKVLTAPAIPLNVRPLPAEGRPSSFTNLIGDFAISCSPAQKTLEVGDSVTLTVTVSGYGNIWDAVEPKMDALADLKVYSDKPTLEKSVHEGRIRGVMTSKRALVPLKEGKITIPPLKMAFFNTRLQKYQQALTKPIQLNVLPSSEKEKLNLVEASGITPTKQAVKVIGKDILPIHSSLDALRNQDFNPFTMFYCLLLAIPMVGYGAGLGIKRRKDRLANDQGFVRSSKAMGKFDKAQKEVASHLEDGASEECCRLISRAFKEYLGDKIDVVGSALTPQEAEGKLRERKIDQHLAQEVRMFLEVLEKAQFSTAAQVVQEREELLKRARKFVKALERRLR